MLAFNFKTIYIIYLELIFKPLLKK